MTEQEQLEVLERRLRAAFARVPAPAFRPMPLPAQPGGGGARRRRLPLWAPLAAAAALALVAALLPWPIGTPHTVPRDVPHAERPAPAAVWRGHGLVITTHAEAAPSSCRLPVTVVGTGASGFVQLGNGTPTFTPASGSGTYVPALNTWAGVLPQDVSPSGDAYVDETSTYGPNAQDTIRIVRAGGTSSTFQPPKPQTGVLGWTKEGILLLRFGFSSSTDGPTTEAWLLDPSSGATRPFSIASWVGGYAPADDSLWGQAPAGAPLFGPVQGSSSMWAGGSILISQSVATGAVQEWLGSSQSGLPLNNQQGPLAHFVGSTAAGDPIIQLGSSDITHLQPDQQNSVSEWTLLLTSPGHETVINQGVIGAPDVAADLSPLSVTSGGTVWMADDQGRIWTYTQAGGMREVAQIQTINNVAPGVAISGPCV